MPSRRLWRGPTVVAVLTTLVVAVTVLPGSRAAGAAIDHIAPVPGPITERFDLPPRPWQPGNRGVDFTPEPGTPVVASADGEVVFAGQVGGHLHVTVRHADGLRTSYSFLAELEVVTGAEVRGGQRLGVAGAQLHFGVRAPDGTYLDPAALLAGLLEGRPVLVPSTAEGADPLEERRHLLSVVADGIELAVGVPADVAGATSAVGEAVTVAQTELREMVIDVHLLAGDELVAAVRDQLGIGCTDGGRARPVLEERRIMVLVSGLGTGSEGNSAFDLPADELGYADADVVRFSYRGGRAPAAGAPPRGGAIGLAGIEQRPFDGIDSQRSLTDSAAELADLVVEVAEREPGVPIDVVAHSQGGVVSRVAIDAAGRDGSLPEEVETLVTLGSPHAGAWLADGVDAGQSSATGRAVIDELVARGFEAPLDPDLPSIPDLSTDSSVLVGVRDQPLPDGVRFTSIGGRWDLIVPAGRTRDAAARHVVVDPASVTDDAHSALTESPEALRELALAVDGMDPTCQALLDRLADLAASEAVGGLERGTSDLLEVSAPVIDQLEPSEHLVAEAVGRAASGIAGPP